MKTVFLLKDVKENILCCSPRRSSHSELVQMEVWRRHLTDSMGYVGVCGVCWFC